MQPRTSYLITTLKTFITFLGAFSFMMLPQKINRKEALYEC